MYDTSTIVDGNNWYWRPPLHVCVYSTAYAWSMMLGATTPVGSLVRMLLVWKAGTRSVRRDIHLLRKEERQVPRKGRLYTIGPLIQKNAVTAPDHRAVVIERPAQIPFAGARRILLGLRRPRSHPASCDVM